MKRDFIDRRTKSHNKGSVEEGALL